MDPWRYATSRNSLNAFFAETHHDITCWGVASVCSSVLLLLAYSCLPHVRRTPGWHFLYSSLCEIFVAVGLILFSLHVKHGERDIERAMCQEYNALLLGLLAFDVMANCWRLCMYVDLIVVYHNPFWPNESRPLYHLVVMLLGYSYAAALYNSDLLCDSSSPDGTDGHSCTSP